MLESFKPTNTLTNNNTDGVQQQGEFVTWEEAHPLVVSELVLTPERMVEFGLTPEQQAFLSQYEPIRFKVWSEVPVYDDFRLSKFVTVGLAEGLISNHDEWDNPHQSFIKTLRTACSNTLTFRSIHKPIAFVAVSCPGFGGTKLKDPKKATLESVSSSSYAKLLGICGQIFSPKVIVGHSAGGEASLQYSFQKPRENEKKVPVVALHPAVSKKNQGIFRTISNLDATNRFFKQLLVFNPIVEAIEEQVMSRLVGANSKTKAAKWQLALHKKEIEENEDAYRLKNQELEIPDEPSRYEEYSMQALPTILLGSTDRLTTEANARTFLPVIRQLIMEKLGANASLYVDSEADLELLGRAVDQSIVTGNWGHDAVFFDQTAQESAAKLVSEQLEISLLRESWYFQEVIKIGALLKQQNFPLQFELEPETKGNAKFEKATAVLAELDRRESVGSFVNSVFLFEKQTLRHSLEQRHIMVNWIQLLRALVDFHVAIDNKIKSGEVATEEEKATLEKMVIDMVTLVTKTPSVELYLQGEGKEYVNETLLQSMGLVTDLLFNNVKDIGKPNVLPRKFFKNQDIRFNFKSSLSDLVLEVTKLNMGNDTYTTDVLQTVLEKVKKALFYGFPLNLSMAEFAKEAGKEPISASMLMLLLSITE